MAVVCLPVKSPRLGMELRLAPLGNTFLNWPEPDVEEGKMPIGRARARSCPGHLSLMCSAAPVIALGLADVTEPAPATKLVAACTLPQSTGPDSDLTAKSDTGECHNGQNASPAGKGNHAFLDKARPSALHFVKEKVIMDQVGSAADDTGCRTTTTRCSDTWCNLQGDDSEWINDDEKSEDLDTDAAVASNDGHRLAELDAEVDQPHSGSATELANKPHTVKTGSSKSKIDGATTLMIQRLPVDLSQVELITALNRAGFQGEYNFLYVPTSFGTGLGSGYGFVNFVTPCSAHRLFVTWNRNRPFGKRQDKVLNITAAHIQGHDANMAKWNTPKMQRVRNQNHRPLVSAQACSDLPGMMQGEHSVH